MHARGRCVSHDPTGSQLCSTGTKRPPSYGAGAIVRAAGHHSKPLLRGDLGRPGPVCPEGDLDGLAASPFGAVSLLPSSLALPAVVPMPERALGPSRGRGFPVSSPATHPLPNAPTGICRQEHPWSPVPHPSPPVSGATPADHLQRAARLLCLQCWPALLTLALPPLSAPHPGHSATAVQ